MPEGPDIPGVTDPGTIGAPILGDPDAPARLFRWLSERWGPERECPYCQTHQWFVDPFPISVPRQMIPGALVNFVVLYYAVTCSYCGHTVFINKAQVDGGQGETAVERPSP